jgi:endoglucanase
MNRPVLVGLLALLAALCSGPPALAGDYGWFKKEFVSADGRVIDPSQDMASHSEGQGYGMLLALVAGDREGFQTLWRWSRDNLQVRDKDNLLAWKWGRRRDGTWRVIDYNNATDGDLLVAAALALAGEKWDRPGYVEAALRMAADIRSHLVVEYRGLKVLLPGYHGFVKGENIVFNPSYLVFGAFDVLGRVENAEFWAGLRADSLELLSQCLYTRFGLPPDWVMLTPGGAEPATSRSAVFGYEALRVVLYLAWAGELDVLTGLRDYLDLVERLGAVPTVVDLQNEAVGMHQGPGGFQSVFALAAEKLGRGKLARALKDKAAAKLAREPRDYYSHVLDLLSGIDSLP